MRRLGWIYTAAGTLWIVLWQSLGDRNGWLALINAWAFWGLLTLLPVGTWRWWSRSRWLGSLWLATVGTLFYRTYGWLWQRPHGGPTACSPGRASQPEAPTAPAVPELRRTGQTQLLAIFSANLLNVPRDLSSAMGALCQTDLDLLLFQEAIDSHTRQLERGLASVYPHRCWVPYLPTNMGLGVASRIPFAVTGFWQKPGLDPYALRVTLALAHGPLDVYCIHCIAPTHQIRRWGPTRLLRTREQQVKILLTEIRQRQMPAILAGDWNRTEAADSYGWTTAQLMDGWVEGGSGPGWSWPRRLGKPNPRPALPLLRLDYLFHTGPQYGRTIYVESMQVGSIDTGSDHSPITARLRIAR